MVFLRAHGSIHWEACTRERLRQGSKVCEVAYASVFQLEGFVEASTRSTTRGLLHDDFMDQMQKTKMKTTSLALLNADLRKMYKIVQM